MHTPNFLIIGVGKSGTTSLHRYLIQHPEVYMCPIKEPHFLAYDEANCQANGPINRNDDETRARTFQEYLQLFDGVVNEKAIGESSASNFSQRACDQARHYLPHARLIGIFRHPVDRAYAEFLHRRRDGVERESSFLTAYRASKSRSQNNWSPQLCYDNSAYVVTLQYWLSNFPRERFKFYLTEDLQADALAVMQDIFRFLEVDDSFKPEVSMRHNTAYAVRSQILGHFSHSSTRNNPIRVLWRKIVSPTMRVRIKRRLSNWNRISAEPLEPEVRRQLTGELHDNILQLQDLIGRDLSHWLY